MSQKFLRNEAANEKGCYSYMEEGNETVGNRYETLGESTKSAMTPAEFVIAQYEAGKEAIIYFTYLCCICGDRASYGQPHECWLALKMIEQEKLPDTNA